MTKSSAFQFFFDNAGFAYDPKKESSFAGQVRVATDLARAEFVAWDNDYTFEWSQDDQTNEAWEGAKGAPFYYLWNCAMFNAAHVCVQSLGGIDFGRDGDPWSDTYRRVVEAELAWEELARIV